MRGSGAGPRKGEERRGPRRGRAREPHLYRGSWRSGLSWKVQSRKTTEAWGRQPTGKVSPTTAHWGRTDGQPWVGVTGLPPKWVSRAWSGGCPGPALLTALHPSPHLGLPCQSQDLPQVVQEPNEVEPVWRRGRDSAG